MKFERTEKKPVRLTVRVAEAERTNAELAASKAGVTLSELMRAALRAATAEVLGQPS